MQNENEKKEPEITLDLDHMTYKQMSRLADLLRSSIKQGGVREMDSLVYLLGLVEYASWKRFMREE